MQMNTARRNSLKEFNGIYKEMDDLYHEAARGMGLSDSAFDILYTVCQVGDGCLQRDVCRVCYTRKQTVNSSIRKLEREGYLTLRPGKGRDMHIFLTPAGQALVTEKICPVIRMEEEAFLQMSEQECGELLRLSKKYLQKLQEQFQSVSSQ